MTLGHGRRTRRTAGEDFSAMNDDDDSTTVAMTGQATGAQDARDGRVGHEGESRRARRAGRAGREPRQDAAHRAGPCRSRRTNWPRWAAAQAGHAEPPRWLAAPGRRAGRPRRAAAPQGTSPRPLVARCPWAPAAEAAGPGRSAGTGAAGGESIVGLAAAP
jgi:hypothetical protein